MNPSSTVDDSRTCFNMLAPKIARTRLRLQSSFPILASVQTPEPFEPEDEVTVEPARPGPPRAPQPRLGGSSFWALGARLTWLSGLLLAVSAFTDWYAGSGDGITIAVTGWHTGTLGKLVFFIGLAHAFINTLMYLDADRRGFDYPVVPLHVNCYGNSLVRSQGGRLPLGEIGREPDPPAPSAAACFDLGRAIGRVLAPSPWRVALIASSSWSHAFLTRKNDWIYPDHTADRARLAELREGRFASWRELTREQLEDAGQHEMLNWITLAGAMAELDHKAEIIDFIETHVLNSNKCFAAWI